MWRGMGHSGAQWRTVDAIVGDRAVFLGEYRHTLDPKGRVVLPSDFRPQLAEGCVITKGQERCLYVYPLARWAQEVEEMNLLSRKDMNVRFYRRSVYSGARQQALDAQGRVTVPEQLRAYAGLEKDVVVIGVADMIEIWDQESWDDFSKSADEYYASIKEGFTEERA